MAEQIRLKSRAEEVYDFRQVDISQFLTGFTADEGLLQKDLDRILRRHGRKEEAAAVSEGDTVTVSCASELPRYNKKGMPVQIGKGLFNRELEQDMIGMGKGETKEFAVDGSKVTVTVDRIIHTVLPELSDEAVAGFGMEGITSTADLRRFCIGKQVETFVLEDENPDMASAYVWQELAKHSVVVRDPEEIAFAENKAEKKLAELSKMPGESEDPDKESGLGIDLDMLRNMYFNELDLAAIGEKMMEEDGEALTMDDYAGHIGRLMEAYPNKSREELEQENTVLNYAIEKYADYLAHALDVYVAGKFKEHFTKE